MIRKFLVCRKELLRLHNVVSGSDHFPMIVEIELCDDDEINYEEILYKAFEQINPRGTYRPQGQHYSYTIVPMAEAVTIRLKPKQEYDVVVEQYA